MNELLFENYLIPKVSYGIDGLFSLYKNQPNFAKNKTTAMVISFGFHTIHFMPVVDGKIDAENMRRLNVGGFHLTNFLHRGLQACLDISTIEKNCPMDIFFCSGFIKILKIC